MTIAIARDPIYRRRRFESEIIELCARWYLTYRLSYRDLVEMMAWVRYARPVHSSWRMDETAVSVRGGSHYLYWAVDKHGKTVDSLLCTDRSDLAARAFFTKALETHHPRWPRRVNLDGNAASHRALRLLRRENSRWQHVLIRSRRDPRHGCGRSMTTPRHATTR